MSAGFVPGVNTSSHSSETNDAMGESSVTCFVRGVEKLAIHLQLQQ